MSEQPPRVRYVDNRPSERVEVNDAVIMYLENGRSGRLHTDKLAGCTAIASYQLDSSGQSLLGLSHTSPGVDVVSWPGEPDCPSAWFTRRLKQHSCLHRNLRAAHILVATAQNPGYDNSKVLADIDIAIAEIRELGNITLHRATYVIPSGFYAEHGVDVTKTKDSLRMTLSGDLAGSRQTLFHVETPIRLDSGQI